MPKRKTFLNDNLIKFQKVRLRTSTSGFLEWLFCANKLITNLWVMSLETVHNVACWSTLKKMEYILSFVSFNMKILCVWTNNFISFKIRIAYSQLPFARKETYRLILWNNQIIYTLQPFSISLMVCWQQITKFHHSSNNVLSSTKVSIKGLRSKIKVKETNP